MFSVKHYGVVAAAAAALFAGQAQAGTYVVDVSNISSFDSLGSALNTVLNLQVGANAHVIGVEWSVNLTAYSPSWLSELGVAFTNGAFTDGVLLRPGAGNNGSGTGTYTGTLDLITQGLDFNVDADGVLRLEFYENYADGLNPDGRWNFGTLTFTTAPVPEPSTYGLMALGLVGIGAIARRRKAQ